MGISAEARGKELKVFLKDIDNPEIVTHIVFRFGMSGCFKFTEFDELPKHAHLQFSTVTKKPVRVLSFVDYRRFGRWEIEGEWGKDRGPDPFFDYENFRKNVLDNLDRADFNRPICEALLNQKYFNGIGNYLRAEILFRAKVPPFTKAREVLVPLAIKSEEGPGVKSEGPDVLALCNIVPLEVFGLDKGKNYDPDSSQSESRFSSWLQCYYVEGMNSLQDGNGRTIWFSGEAGPMKPKGAKVVGRKGGKGSKVPKSGSAAVKEETDSKPKNTKKMKVKAEKDAESKARENSKVNNKQILGKKQKVKTETEEFHEIPDKKKKLDRETVSSHQTKVNTQANPSVRQSRRTRK